MHVQRERERSDVKQWKRRAHEESRSLLAHVERRRFSNFFIPKTLAQLLSPFLFLFFLLLISLIFYEFNKIKKNKTDRYR